VTDAAFLAAAIQAMTVDAGPAALDALGWWDVLPHLDEPEARAAAFAVFRAQGRALAPSPALGALLAQPYLDGTDLAPGTVVAAVPRTSARRGPRLVVAGEPRARLILVDLPGRGASLVRPEDVSLRSHAVPGGLDLHEVDLDGVAVTPLLDEAHAAPARRRSHALGRIALALEIVGAAERAVALAVEHATTRTQFGEPIGRFQAVRHLLAWARTDCVAVEALAGHVLALGDAAPDRYDQVLKALAGRNGRRACERALQVLGGIGFTQEHRHHRFHQRVLAADALLGSSADLTADLGAWLRTTAADPGYTRAALRAAAR
jgi:alkylation response protein AidB-like acyl-CoA dehydrogenase